METRMFFRIIKRFFFGFLLLFSVQLQAQENGTLSLMGEQSTTHSDTTFSSAWVPTTSIYLELGGKIMYSLNVDFRKRENFALSIGASFFKEDGNSMESSQTMFFPSAMGYYLGGKRHRIELGGGLFAGFGSDEGFTAMALSGVAGYRYQKKKGLIFRIGFTPFIGIPLSNDDDLAVVPWAAISLGYSF